MKVLVTGGTGFIGSHTVVALAGAGYTPIILDNFSNSEKQVLSGIKDILGYDIVCYENDCSNVDSLRNILKKEKIEGVIHFAAFKAVGESVKNPLKYYDNNLNSLSNLLKAMMAEEVSNIIFSSSATVYGLTDKLPITEETPMQPALSPYGNTKQIGEEMLRDIVNTENNIKAIALRYFNPIGAHSSAYIGELPLGVPNNLVPFITQTAAGLREKLTVFGADYATPDGTCLRDYIHVMDLAEAHVLALSQLITTKNKNFYDVYNVGSGVPNSVKEVISIFEEVSGQKLNHEYGTRRAGDVPALYADVTKIQKDLGWTTKRTLRKALGDAWRWQKCSVPNFQ